MLTTARLHRLEDWSSKDLRWQVVYTMVDFPLGRVISFFPAHSYNFVAELSKFLASTSTTVQHNKHFSDRRPTYKELSATTILLRQGAQRQTSPQELHPIQRYLNTSQLEDGEPHVTISFWRRGAASSRCSAYDILGYLSRRYLQDYEAKEEAGVQ